MGNLFDAHQLEHVSQPLFSAYYYKQWVNYEMGFHQHSSIEIMYVINGHCHIELLPAGTSAPVLFQMKKGRVHYAGWQSAAPFARKGRRRLQNA